MIDVHSHLLPGVDDGSSSFEESLEILKEQINNGVKKVVLTPHYKEDKYDLPVEVIKSKFDEFKLFLKNKGVEIQLYLGQEIYCNENVYNNLKDNKVLTINNTNCILVEFNYFVETDIANYVFNLKALGFIPIIAHVERYAYLDWNTIYDLKQLGALIQTNAGCIIGEGGKKIQKNTLSAIKDGLIDFVATDMHTMRQTHLNKAYSLVSKKISKQVADDIFKNNAIKYLSV